MNHKADIVQYIYLLITKLIPNQRQYLIQRNMMFERNVLYVWGLWIKLQAKP